MGRKDEILEYCKKSNRKLTAVDIINALYPGKPQPYINSQITELVQEKKLVREDTRPYTVRALYDGEIVNNVIDYTRTHSSKNKVDIPYPSMDEVEKYLNTWKGLENYTLQESALNKLFLKAFPCNTEIEDVLIKVSTLNDFYSTNIFSVYPVAKHIVSLNIDERLNKGDISLVNDLADVTMENGLKKNFYSFATKYCSHHQPEKYAIYDSYVEKVLKHFRNADGFSIFTDFELKDYTVFSRVLNEFRKFYGLEQYNLKDIDRYLWQLGKAKFPKIY